MSQYLLLRDNKQSGPYNFDELTAKGLKAYDLIWIEGKSAAWRYPSEIQELKPFAPVVEEQPYDRFYKRQNSSVKKPQEAVAASTATSANNFSASTNTQVENTTQSQVNTNNATEPSQPKKTSPNTLPNRRVVVIMPGGMNKEPQRESVFFHETVENKIAQPEKKPVTPETRTPQPEKQVGYNKEVTTRKTVPALPLYDEELVDFRKAPLANTIR